MASRREDRRGVRAPGAAPPRRGAGDQSRFLVVLACFVLSGFAGLVYQTAWTRELAFVFGTSELAVATVLATGHTVPSGAAVYFRLLRALNRLADRVTGALQNGSLPFYAGVILTTAALLPGVVLLTEVSWPGWPEVVDAPAHVPLVAIMLGSAVAAATVRRRFAAMPAARAKRTAPGCENAAPARRCRI